MNEKSIFKDGANKKMTHPRNERGITLVALVITIIILLILAGVAISTLTGKDNIIKNAGTAVGKYNEQNENEKEQMSIIAEYLKGKLNPDGETDDDSTTNPVRANFVVNPQAYRHESQSSEIQDIAISDSGESVNLDLWAYKLITDEESGAMHYDLTTGEGYIQTGKYTKNSSYDSTMLSEGKIQGEIPAYIYNAESGVVIDVKAMTGTFAGITELIEVPELPKTVTGMKYTFAVCTSLTTVPEILSPVTDMSYAFYGCTSLINTPRLPNTIASMNYAFMSCSNLAVITNIPTGVTAISNAFEQCTELTIVPTLPDTLEKMNSTFDGCEKLTTVTNFPSQLKNLFCTFRDCKALQSIPAFHSGLTSLEWAFSGCSSLQNIPEIPESVINMRCAFRNCTSLETAPEIPKNVNDLDTTFFGCSNLQGELIIRSTSLEETSYSELINCFNYACTADDITLVVKCSSTDVKDRLSGVISNEKITVEDL